MTDAELDQWKAVGVAVYNLTPTQERTLNRRIAPAALGTVCHPRSALAAVLPVGWWIHSLMVITGEKI